jgi:hypothetical protein
MYKLILVYMCAFVGAIIYICVCVYHIVDIL